MEVVKYIVSHRSGTKLCKPMVLDSYEQAINYVHSNLICRTLAYLNEYYPEKYFETFKNLSTKQQLEYAKKHGLVRGNAFIGYSDWEEYNIHEMALTFDDYIAGILWKKEDIADQMVKMDIEPTEENIEAVVNSGLLKKLNECRDEDWNIIENAIKETLVFTQERDL